MVVKNLVHFTASREGYEDRTAHRGNAAALLTCGRDRRDRSVFARHAHWLPLAVLAVSAAACGGGSGKPPAVESPFIHSPPVGTLSGERLRALSMECERYVPTETQRGPYDAAYCRDAIDAWADAPLESVGVFDPATKQREAPSPAR